MIFFLKKMLCLCAVCSIMAFSAPHIWDGSADTTWYKEEAKTFSLTTPEQLAGFAKLVNRGRHFKDKTVFLENDVFLNDTVGVGAGTWASYSHTKWTPIGVWYGGFEGSFGGREGTNPKIYGLYINDTTKDYVGFFGDHSGVISNLEIKGGLIKGKNYVGTIAGHVLCVDCKKHCQGTLTATEITVMGNSYVGGLFGSTSDSVTSSLFKGRVFGSGNYVGGLVGSGKDISKSSATGIVKSDSNYVGGIAGKARLVDSSSYVNGAVEGRNYVGGVVGSVSEYVSNSYFEGDVVGLGDYVGGIAGKARFVDSSSYVDGAVEGRNYVGGVVGSVSEYVLNSYFEGDVVGLGDCVGGLIGFGGRALKSYFVGDVEGYNYVGGLIGKSVYCANEMNRETFYLQSRSSSTGRVKGNSYVGGAIGLDSVYLDSSGSTFVGTGKISSLNVEGSVNGETYVGGILGGIKYSSEMNNSVSILELKIDSCSHTKGNVIGSGNYVGGLVGYGDYNSSVLEMKIDSCSHTKGNVIGSGNYVGGLVGYGNGLSISKSFAAGIVKSDSNYVGGIAGVVRHIDSSFHVDGVVEGHNYVGGVAGAVSDSVSNSYSEGNIVGSGNYVGGLVGFGKRISKSHFVGAVEGYNYVGGLVGRSDGSVLHSYAKGNVTGVSDVGGLAGEVRMIKVSYMEGSVHGDGCIVGGLTGHIDHPLIIHSVDSSYYIGGEVTGGCYVGGLIGYSSRELGAQGGGIYNSFVVGDVFASGDGVGGLVGRFDGAHYGGEDSISRSYAIGEVLGADGVGGLIGQAFIARASGSAKISIKESYVSENVKALSGDSVGCVVGTRYGGNIVGFSSSFYDWTKCNHSDYAPAFVGARTTVEMQTRKTYTATGWNRDPYVIWKFIDESTPFLLYYTKMLNGAIVSIDSLEEFEYDGNAKTPHVESVILFGDTLIYGTDYTVDYKNNVNAGKASVSVCGIGQYEGCKIIDFKIRPYDGKPIIKNVEKAVYTGEALTPKIVGHYEKPHLSHMPSVRVYLADSNYTLDYRNNVNAGLATVVLNMVGNFTGTATATFIIEKAIPNIVQNPSAGDVLLSETLVSSELSDGRANVDGLFEWKNPKTYPMIENSGYAVTFIPSDTANYESVELTVPIKVWDVANVVIQVGNASIDRTVLAKGTNYTLPAVPDSVGYNFVGFYDRDLKVGNSGDEITVNEDVVLSAKYEIKTFVVKFVNDCAEIQSSNIAYGTIPTYLAEEPSKPATAQYTYTFKDWTPMITLVTDNATYAAVFDSVINKYGVSFKDYDGSILKAAVQYDYGTSSINIAKPANPARQETAKYIYTFKGWNATIADVTENAVYTAEYDSTVKKYTISFINGDKILQTSSIAYGEMPEYTGNTPTKASTKSYSYEFIGWSPKLESVTKETDYVAVFDSTSITGIVNVANLNMSIHTVSRSVQISAAPLGVVYALLDAQGRVLKKGRVESPNFNILIPQSGTYFIKVGSFVQRIGVK